MSGDEDGKLPYRLHLEEKEEEDGDGGGKVKWGVIWSKRRFTAHFYPSTTTLLFWHHFTFVVWRLYILSLVRAVCLCACVCLYVCLCVVVKDYVMPKLQGYV